MVIDGIFERILASVMMVNATNGRARSQLATDQSYCSPMKNAYSMFPVVSDGVINSRQVNMKISRKMVYIPIVRR